MQVNDIFTDLSDGIRLMKLLELISGESLGKPETGRLRVHKLGNVAKCLAFVNSKVRSLYYNLSELSILSVIIGSYRKHWGRRYCRRE